MTTINFSEKVPPGFNIERFNQQLDKEGGPVATLVGDSVTAEFNNRSFPEARMQELLVEVRDRARAAV